MWSLLSALLMGVLDNAAIFRLRLNSSSAARFFASAFAFLPSLAPKKPAIEPRTLPMLASRLRLLIARY
jgi:hypothetical protein